MTWLARRRRKRRLLLMRWSHRWSKIIRNRQSVSSRKARRHHRSALSAMIFLHHCDALRNVIDNGLHYGSRVTIDLGVEADWVDIILRDNGPGIDAAHIGDAVQPFFTSDKARSRNKAGAGIGTGIGKGIGMGLAITNAIITAHHGTLETDQYRLRPASASAAAASPGPTRLKQTAEPARKSARSNRQLQPARVGRSWHGAGRRGNVATANPALARAACRTG